MDRSDLQVGAFEGPKRPLGLLEVLVGAYNVLIGERLGREAGPQDVEPVQRGLGGDLFALRS